MTGSSLSGDHHVARLIKGTQHQDDVVLGPAFALREDDEGLCSVNWLERLAGNRSSQLSELRTFINAHFTIRASHKLAILNVGHTIENVLARCDKKIDVIENPVKDETKGIDNFSHSAIVGYTADDQLVADQIAHSVLSVETAKT